MSKRLNVNYILFLFLIDKRLSQISHVGLCLLRCAPPRAPARSHQRKTAVVIRRPIKPSKNHVAWSANRKASLGRARISIPEAAVPVFLVAEEKAPALLKWFKFFRVWDNFSGKMSNVTEKTTVNLLGKEANLHQQGKKASYGWNVWCN